MKAQIKTLQNGYTFLNFFNTKEVYARQGFDTNRKALNYAKKYSVVVVDTMPEEIDAESILMN